MDIMDLINIAKDVFKIETAQINLASQLIDNQFKEAVKMIAGHQGKLIITGMGKSGLIGKKIAATLASTGTSSFFLHPGEAYHGDLGMIEKEDTLLLISNSGETDEVLRLIPFLQNQGNATIAMTGNPKSTLAKNAHYHLNIGVKEEACPLQLAPTCSTTVTLVMGDALAVALMKYRDFKAVNFARFHPGGSLGRKLLTKVEDVMKCEKLPIVTTDTTAKGLIQVMTEGKTGLAVILKEKKAVGIITDGDLRRAMEESTHDFFHKTARDLMTPNPKTVLEGTLLVVAEETMLNHSISALLVVDQKEALKGILELFDIR